MMFHVVLHSEEDGWIVAEDVYKRQMRKRGVHVWLYRRWGRERRRKETNVL